MESPYKDSWPDVCVCVCVCVCAGYLGKRRTGTV